MPRTPTKTLDKQKPSVAGHPYALGDVTCKTECVHDDWSNAFAGSSRLRQHVCPTCNKVFTTTGHLKRHVQIHTGEKNHKCPFPGCETRCSRQDNLQQHYKIHLSNYTPRSLSKSTKGSSAPQTPIASTPTSDQGSMQYAASPTSMDSPPALDDSSYSPQSSDYSPPPDTPPQLVQAILPIFDTLPPYMAVAQLTPAVRRRAVPFRPRMLHIPETAFPKVNGEGYKPNVHDMQPYAQCCPVGAEVPSMLCSTPSPNAEACSPMLVHPIPRISQPRSCLLDNTSFDTYEIQASFSQGYCEQPVGQSPPTVCETQPLTLDPRIPGLLEPLKLPIQHVFEPQHVSYHPIVSSHVGTQYPAYYSATNYITAACEGEGYACPAQKYQYTN